MKRISWEASVSPTDRSALDAAVHAAREIFTHPGSVALFPTETVYGLVCRADDRTAIDRIYELKQRSDTKPLGVFVASAARLEAAGAVTSPAAEKLIAAFCPGPITMIVATTAGGTLGFRIPDHPLLLRLLNELPFPLAQTSANRSGRPNVLTVDAALAELAGAPDLVIDGGALPADARASTVVNLAVSPIKVLREGPISAAEIHRVLEA